MSSQEQPDGTARTGARLETMTTLSEGTRRLRDLETSAVGLLTVQLVIGYEWVISGWTKLWRGGFAVGLSDELRDSSRGVSGWFRSFLDDTVIPHGWAFGWFVLAAELAVGTALLGTATVFLVRRHRLRFSTRQLLLAVTAFASVGGILMNLSFHLANGDPHPWLIPRSGFDEGVDLDSVMPLVQLAFVVVATKLFLFGRETRRKDGRVVRAEP